MSRGKWYLDDILASWEDECSLNFYRVIFRLRKVLHVFLVFVRRTMFVHRTLITSECKYIIEMRFIIIVRYSVHRKIDFFQYTYVMYYFNSDA